MKRIKKNNLENITLGAISISSLFLGFGIYTYSILSIHNKTINPIKIYQIEKQWKIEKNKQKQNQDYKYYTADEKTNSGKV